MSATSTPTARTLLSVYDLLHFFCLHGPAIPRDLVISYWARVIGGTQASPASQARSFERMKRHLEALGVSYASSYQATSQKTETLFVIHRPRHAKALVERRLNGLQERDIASQASA